MTHTTAQERALADLRHMYAQMVGGMVKDSAQAKRIADGILSRAIQKLEQAARRAPLVIDTRARYSGSIQELKQYASEDVDAMVHICNKHIGNVPKGFFLAMQECAALVGRAPAVPVPQFNHSAKRKLNYLLEAGETITGYAFQNKDGRRGSIDCHGFVAWWHDAAAPQPPEAALVPSIAVTPEMVEAANEAYCPFGDMELALCAALQVAPIPPGAAPVQLPENLREGAPYDNPAFEALARALGVWGTAQSAVCAQFWIAAKEQST